MPEPLNPLVHIAESDINTPSTGLPNKKVPNTSLLTIGWDKDQVFAANHFNYIFDNLAQYIVWLQEQKDELQQKVDSLELPVGSVYENAINGENPATLLGYGVWEAFAEGQITVGVGTHTDDAGLEKIWGVGDSEGEYKHTQTLEEVATHGHNVGVSLSENTHSHGLQLYSGDDTGALYPIDGEGIAGSTASTEEDTHNHTVTVTQSDAGSSTAMNNIQPSIATYKWVRIE